MGFGVETGRWMCDARVSCEAIMQSESVSGDREGETNDAYEMGKKERGGETDDAYEMGERGKGERD